MQGESDRAEENEVLGEFVLTGLRKAASGEVEIDVTFDISADGIVSVKALDLETGKAQSITVTATSGLTEEEISRMVAENQDYSVAVKKSDDEDGRREMIRRNIREIERLMPVVQEKLAGNSLGGDALARAQQALDAGRNAVQSSSGAMLASSAEALDRTLSVFRGIADRG
jgi:molecular chaperone DnaK